MHRSKLPLRQLRKHICYIHARNQRKGINYSLIRCHKVAHFFPRKWEKVIIFDKSVKTYRLSISLLNNVKGESTFGINGLTEHLELSYIVSFCSLYRSLPPTSSSPSLVLHYLYLLFKTLYRGRSILSGIKRFLLVFAGLLQLVHWYSEMPRWLTPSSPWVHSALCKLINWHVI